MITLTNERLRAFVKNNLGEGIEMFASVLKMTKSRDFFQDTPAVTDFEICEKATNVTEDWKN